mgnify:CR=1 FL=1
MTIQKFDPYINIDPGTLNPYEHGECYVTVDGHEADLDLGHYERFLASRQLKPITLQQDVFTKVLLTKNAAVTIWENYSGYPHITDEIKRNVKLLGSKYKFDLSLPKLVVL